MVSLLERLMRQISVAPFTPLGLPSPCWEWMGSHDRFGHGRVKVDGRNVHVRRLVVEARGETLGPNDNVIALCGNSRCVADDHLVVGTADEVRAFDRFGHVGIGDLLVAQQMIANGKATADYIAFCWGISEALLISAMAKCSWEDQAFKKAS